KRWRPIRQRNSMRRWGLRTSSCAARSRVCGPICLPTPNPAGQELTRRMTRNLIAPIAAILLATALMALVTAVFTAAPVASAPQTSGPEVQLATIKQYCAGCHNDRAKAAGVSFEGLTPESIGRRAELFEKAVRKLRGRVMPPP